MSNLVQNFKVNSANVQYGKDEIVSEYVYSRNEITQEGNATVVKPSSYKYSFKTNTKVPKMGLMLVGIAGNNGTTVVGTCLANKLGLTWKTKCGEQKPNYFGSLTQATTVRLGATADGKEVFTPFNKIVPMVNPSDLVIGGWDINNLNLADAMNRAGVFEYDLQRQLRPYMEKMQPLPSIYYPDFIAANQNDRANNLVPKGTKQQDLERIRGDIRNFKKANNLDTVVVLWTANTERFTDVRPGLNMTSEEVLAAIARNDPEISPSNIFAVASILENTPYINGSPQNTLVPGVIELAQKKHVYIGGDDFKSGQTKMKSVLVDFLIGAGIKPRSIVSWNHLGNNDGKNLSAPEQFRSKEISKSNVVDDMVASNQILYKPGEHPDHVVVIKYVPHVGDGKRAMDEYVSEIAMGGESVITLYNLCQDSLLAAPLILDLALITELFTRITYKTSDMTQFQQFDVVLTFLSYLLKAPLTQNGAPIVNALFKQQKMVTNVLLACVGLNPENEAQLEYKTRLPKAVVAAKL